MKLFLLSLFCSLPVFAQQPILVGGYEFPPYVTSKNGVYQGLALDFIELLNQKQKKFSFQFYPTSAPRRYHDMSVGRYQIILFESKTWGWNSGLVDSSKIFHHGGEVFITLKDGKKTQSYFKDLKNKRIRGIRGYHYGFLGFSTGAKARKEFNLELTSTHDGNILAVLNKRAEMAILPKEYLDMYLHENPDSEKRLLVSKDYDQIYQLSGLVYKGQSLISANDLNKVLDTVIKDGSWDALLKKKGISKITP